MKYIRLDKLLVARGHANSIATARALIMSGDVLLGDLPALTAGMMVASDAVLRLRKTRSRYVSRGGEKLAHALRIFACDVNGLVAVDVGASTGGFTDCLLQHGAARVYAIDVGYGQLAEKLRRDARVVVIDRTNIRTLDPEGLPEKARLAVVDVSFISLSNVLPALAHLLEPGAHVIALVKPQFEIERADAPPGGVVRSLALQKQAVDRIVRAARELRWSHTGTTPSPITGRKGNREFFLHFEITP